MQIHPLLMNPSAVGMAWRSLVTLAENADGLSGSKGQAPWPKAALDVLDEVRGRWADRFSGDFRVDHLAPLFQRADPDEMPGIILVLKGTSFAPWLEEPLVSLQGRILSLCGGLQEYLRAEPSEVKMGGACRAVRLLETGDTARIAALMACSGLEERFSWVRLQSLFLMSRVVLFCMDLLETMQAKPGTHSDLIARELESECVRLEGLRDALHGQLLGVAGYEEARINSALSLFRVALQSFPDWNAFQKGMSALILPPGYGMSAYAAVPNR